MIELSKTKTMNIEEIEVDDGASLSQEEIVENVESQLKKGEENSENALRRKYFRVSPITGSDKLSAICKACGVKLSFKGKDTSNLTRHLVS